MRNTTEQLLWTAPVNLDAECSQFSKKQLDEIRIELEALATRAAEHAAYIDMRVGSGCGDQGHTAAVKAFNKAGKTVRTKAFGYNAYHSISF